MVGLARGGGGGGGGGERESMRLLSEMTKWTDIANRQASCSGYLTPTNQPAKRASGQLVRQLTKTHQRDRTETAEMKPKQVTPSPSIPTPTLSPSPRSSFLWPSPFLPTPPPPQHTHALAPAKGVSCEQEAGTMTWLWTVVGRSCTGHSD